MVDSRGPVSRAEWALLALTLLGMPALIFFEWQVWHPGWARVDESSAILWIQRWRDGIDADIRATNGTLHHALLLLSSRLFGSTLFSLHIPQTAALLLESLLLFDIASSRFGKRCGVWSALCNLLASFTLMRGRSLLSYSMVPLELLLLFWLFPKASSPLKRFFWALLLGCMSLDYEVWLYGIAIVSIFAFFSDRSAKNRVALALGLALSLAAVAWVSRDWFASYVAVRQSKSAASGAAAWLLTLLSHIKDYFWGGSVFPYIGTANHGVFPSWALPGLGLGIYLAFLKNRWLILWLILGLLPLAFRSPGLEPQRALLAWPALCLGGGLGMGWLASRAGHKALALLLALPLAGFAWELRAHSLSMNGAWADIYGPSAAQIMAIESIQASKVKAMSNLDFQSTGPARFFLGESSEADETAALMPMYALPALAGERGKTQLFSDPRGGKTFLLFYPEQKSLESMRARERLLKSTWNEVTPRDRFTRALKLEARLNDKTFSDPWLRSVLWTEYLEALHYIGRLEPRHIERLLNESLPTAEPYRETALREGRRHPALGIRLMERAAEIDSRFPFTPEMRAPLEYYLALEKQGAAR